MFFSFVCVCVYKQFRFETCLFHLLIAWSQGTAQSVSKIIIDVDLELAIYKLEQQWELKKLPNQE